MISWMLFNIRKEFQSSLKIRIQTYKEIFTFWAENINFYQLCKPNCCWINFFQRTVLSSISIDPYWFIKPKVHNSHIIWSRVVQVTSATGLPPNTPTLKTKQPHSKLWPLGSLAYHRLGSNTSVLSRVHLQLPSIFSSPMW